MEKREKLSNKFGLVLNSVLIAIGALFVIGGLIYLPQYSSIEFLGAFGSYFLWGLLSLMLLGVLFLVAGIMNTITFSNKKSSYFSNNYPGLVNLFFNGTFLLFFIIVYILFAVASANGNNNASATGFGFTQYAVVIFPLLITCFVLSFISCFQSNDSKSKRILVIIASFLTLITTAILLALFNLTFHIFVFALFFLLEIAIAIYIIMDIKASNESKVDLEKTKVVEIEENNKETATKVF